MKKYKAFLGVALLMIGILTAAAAEEIDLASMTWDQLRALQQKVSAEIVKRPEWKEVTVPAGLWLIGEDIPAGVYAFRLPEGVRRNYVHVWGAEKDNFSANGGLVYNPDLDQDNPVYGRVRLEDGYLLDLEKPLVLTPVVSLGF